MDPEQLKTVRKERSAREAERLAGAIDEWLERRRAEDCNAAGEYVGRHKSQLETLRVVLQGGAQAIAGDIATLDPRGDDSVGAFYEQCRDLDQAIVWLTRLWEFFREKFDQRDDAQLGGVVAAADEVIWSCFHEVVERARLRKPDLPLFAAPLAYIAPEFSPAAAAADQPLPRGLAPSMDVTGWDDELKELIRTLPLPLLRLPPWCVSGPWWLVYVAHEVGHHVQGNLDLIGHVRKGVLTAVTGVVPQDFEKRWRNWSEEIFADFFSVAMMGSTAVWSIVEIEWSDDASMVAPKRDYPPPLVRIALAAETGRRLGLDVESALRGLDPAAFRALSPEVGPLLDAVAPVVDFLCGDLPAPLGQLRGLCAFEAEGLEKSVAWWSASLSRLPAQPFAAKLVTARRVAAGSLAAWAALPEQHATPEERAAAAMRLAKRTVDVLRKSGPPGTRSGAQPAAERADLGEILARQLVQNSRRLRQSAGS